MEEYLIDKLIPKLNLIDNISDKIKMFLKFMNKVIIDHK